MPSKIFINYRREDSIATAGRLRDRLAQTFGQKNLFMDVDSIALGRDFRSVLQEVLASCDLMLVLIGRNWVDVKDEEGRTRLENPGDFVRLEIEAALKRDIAVTPVPGARRAHARRREATRRNQGLGLPQWV